MNKSTQQKNMSSNREVLYRFILVLLPSIIKPTASFSTRTYVGKYFSQHEFTRVRVDDWMGCIVQCYHVPKCVSYNYHVENNTCWLNDHGIEDVYEVDEQLLDYSGWVFQQLKPVTKATNRFSRKTSCPCNCGSKNQCYPPEPGIGDVPEKAAKSCEDILNRRGFVPDGGYYLKTNSHKVYCKMTPITGCDGGGWTLVMKINGNKTTFKYDAEWWENEKLYQDNLGSDLSEHEVKLNTFVKLTFQEICLGMKTNSTIKWVKGDIRDGTQLYAIFDTNIHPSPPNFVPPITIQRWKGLLPGSDVDTAEREEGFNKPKSNSGGKVRIGIVGSRGKSDPVTSYIGFGTGGPDELGRVSCGSVYNNQALPAFCYILVR